MKVKEVLAFLILVIFGIFIISFVSSQSSSNYNITSGGTSNSVGNTSSANYQQGVVLGGIYGNVTSSSYNNFVGFFHGAGGIFVSLISPANGSTLISGGKISTFFVTNFTGSNLVNSTLNIWNSTGNLVNSTTRSITGSINQTNISVLIPYGGTFHWNSKVCSDSDCQWALLNNTLIHETQSNISLNVGWNLFSLTLQHNETDTDRNLSLNPGWNLIGYSSTEIISVNSVQFKNNSGTNNTWLNSASSGRIQAYASYYNSSYSGLTDRRFEYVGDSSLSADDSSLRTHRGYWVYANHSGNLSLLGVGGSLKGVTYNWSDLKLNNGTMNLSITAASNSTYNWVDGEIRSWNGSNFHKVCGNLVDCNATSLNSWEGYFINSNKNNLILIRQG